MDDEKGKIVDLVAHNNGIIPTQTVLDIAERFLNGSKRYGDQAHYDFKRKVEEMQPEYRYLMLYVVYLNHSNHPNYRDFYHVVSGVNINEIEG